MTPSTTRIVCVIDAFSRLTEEHVGSVELSEKEFETVCAILGLEKEFKYQLELTGEMLDAVRKFLGERLPSGNFQYEIGRFRVTGDK